MATSGTTDFTLSIDDLVEEAFEVLEAIDFQGERPALPKWVADWAKSSLLPRVKEAAPSLWH